ncbi:SDR family oxidoreductase (plasmid) [Rhizobium grahamii]|uniref:SDR family oxidoreductase n=1 Tax=Rhizobium grahamii TaxID=1120045 RepID=A0A5Q0CAG4_9HYPH|nr:MULTISPECIES: SDR family NAD(P)-dependent oxidoreductase [Rhizobium]QFY62928.1 SDR family oxidoreductase [Rhizobium grahamii]QRM52319.1 SDR family oxidoreductase [Rhizobium sp. BG6]
MPTEVCLVTGAGSGIGRAAAIALARNGTGVAALDLDHAQANQTASMIANGGRSTAIEADASSEEPMDEAIQQTMGHFGGLDSVVVNARINGTWAPIDDLHADEWDRTMRMNLTSTYVTLNKTVPCLKANGGGSIVIVSSINGTWTFTNPGATAYSATKAAQVAIAQQLALELARFAIRINVVCPGAIDTKISDRTEVRHPERTEVPVIWPQGSVPIRPGEPGRPEDVADLMLFPLSERRHIKGTPTFINGGDGVLR